MENNISNKAKIFLIIGLTKESEHWDDHFVRNLKEKLGIEDVVGIDLPGAGTFMDDDSPNTIRGIVEACRPNYLEKLQDGSNHILIAISLGGMIAMEWLRLYPKDFGRLIILNSSFRGLSPVYKRLQPNAMKSFVQIFRAKTIEKRERGIIQLCCNDMSKHEDTLGKWLQIAEKRPMQKKNMVRQTFAAARYTFRTETTIPTFIIAAQHDRLASYTCSQKLHKKIGGDFYLIDDKLVGHCIHIDAPILLANLISEWVERQA
jgi:pimeloyl-ACP methyl ester carboxylesterase